MITFVITSKQSIVVLSVIAKLQPNLSNALRIKIFTAVKLIGFEFNATQISTLNVLVSFSD